MGCPYFGGAEDRWNIIPFCFTFDGRRDRENGARANTPVRGKGINLWHADTVMLHVPDIPAAALYAYW
jgi:hypothetical protein